MRSKFYGLSGVRYIAENGGVIAEDDRVIRVSPIEPAVAEACSPTSESETADEPLSWGLLATAEGRSQAASKNSAAPAPNQTLNPAIVFSPCTAK